MHRGGSLRSGHSFARGESLVHDEDDGRRPAPGAADADSLVGRLAGQSEMEVNSYHHQSVERPGQILRPSRFLPMAWSRQWKTRPDDLLLVSSGIPSGAGRRIRASKALFSALIEQARLRL